MGLHCGGTRRQAGGDEGGKRERLRGGDYLEWRRDADWENVGGLPGATKAGRDGRDGTMPAHAGGIDGCSWR